ncbi:MAG: DnaJ domain-containing protein [Pseudomonadota bacterium]
MNWLIFLVGLASFLGLGVWYFLTTSPEKIASNLRLILPAVFAVFGIAFIVAGRIAIGAPLLVFAYTLFSRMRGVSYSGGGPARRSTVRSALLEMELDHTTGEMNGLILQGDFEGKDLDSLTDAELMEFAQEASGDLESLQLLEAYLDRRMPTWRDDANTDTGSRHAAPAQSGAMTEQEAYEILGLEFSASVADIRKAHRRLMQSVHPDVGGSAFLAQRINEAKDFLLTLHKNRS